MGFLREVQPEPSEPRHCQRWLGQARQGEFSHFPGGVHCICLHPLRDDLVFFKVFATSERPRYENNIHPN